VAHPPTVPIIIDCDTGIDDSLALLYACASPEADIRAVTCVAGNVDAIQVGINTRAILELAGRDDIEVALGREVPIARPLMTTPETHGPLGVGDSVLPPPSRRISSRHAADLIIEEATRAPGEITLVALGPLTNVAVAVLREPELPVLLRRLVIMGGAYGAPGNTTPVGEWNVSVDPEAMAVVLRAWSPDGPRPWAAAPPRPLALGLDVTEQARMLPIHVDLLAARAGCRADATPLHGNGARDPVVGHVVDALGFYFRFHERFDGFTGAFIHDPLVVAAALDADLVRTRPVTVDVELGGTLTTGQTVADWRGHWGRPPNMDVTVTVSADTFLDRFIERVGGLAVERSGVAR
jgi:purine nucleosidase